MLGKKIATYLGTAAVALALGALVVSSTASAKGGGGTRLEVELSGMNTIGSGKAKWEDRGSRTKASVQAEDLPGTTAVVTFFCEMTTPIAVTLVLGGFDLNLDSRNVLVPNCGIDDTVTVTTDTGATITGVLAEK